MTGQNGIIKILYAFILCALGVMLWFMWHGSVANYFDLSRKFDTTLTDTLINSGVTNNDIVSRTQQEKKTRNALWVVYYKEILLPAPVDENKLVSAIESLAKQQSMTLTRTGVSPGKVTIDIEIQKVLVSRIVFLPQTPLPQTAHKRFAMVIDDVGYTRNLSGLLELNIPITFAILPHEKYSQVIAQDLAQKNMPFILHLPMEPEGYPKVNPGK
jgi:hypothetical protein